MSNKAVAQRYIDEFWNLDRLDVADELFSEDHKYHDPNVPDLPTGAAGVKERGRMYKAAVPGRVAEIHEWIGEGETVVCSWTYVGKHSGPLGEIAPTNREVTIPGVHIWHFRSGRIAESWVMWDRLGLLEQLDPASPAAD